ncbi:DUF6887 family protein [Crocosphaera watsonii WH 8501]|uniref:Uncharacterized protein n=5 Tax=Crocosphaera watsonii TaxID=263511 RepID=T2JZE4_CROWT|nr:MULTISPECIES: hypothetical protein [Crocosphaera]EHJ11648.1 hypothetical protein CWATWH0003_3640 [Crocosphaera watsonii WH 0003]MCH2245219.1 hypothetical protein [Crocosphaera sp.]NQZ60710.1 hypothetical protein [Crocosphaera sp.]CCQ49007.1 FIG00562679: hypothetical protein [Crocosphaera watsonii WH 8502]CCQ53991.1 hypothetical protein CWATWH0005_1603 [Crocosphaera watsonii WH 0005]
MNSIDYNALSLNELRQYVLTHREDTKAFYTYIDRSKSEGKMITVDLEDNHWEEKITQSDR